MSVDEFPDVLTAAHISEHLHLTVQQVYNLFRLSPSKGGIPSFAIGKSKRAMRDDYLNWLKQKRAG